MNFKNKFNDTDDVPAAACNRCGGWTGFGGMSQHRESARKVLGRTGCVCNNSKLREKVAAIQVRGSIT